MNGGYLNNTINKNPPNNIWPNFQYSVSYELGIIWRFAVPSLLDILFQDDHLVAVNKPSGLLVHKSWVAKDAKEFALQMVRDQTGKHVFPIHRLDRPTSGVLLFAFSGETSRDVQNNWEQAEKTYWAVVRGWLKEPILVDHPLKGMADYGQDATTTQAAQTAFQPIKHAEIDAQIDRYPQSRFSWVEAKPKQGRTHQIRRHLKHLSHPIIGDARYGKSKYNHYIAQQYQCPGLLLHARELTITHPITGKPLAINAPLDDRLSRLFEAFNWQ